MGVANLLEPVLTGGIRNVNFVNGRVLTAEDLTAERAANLQRQRLLGQSIGDGVVKGLEVTLSASSKPFGQQVAHVTAGTAVNRNGDVLSLDSDVDIALTPAAQTTAPNAGLFTVCQPPVTDLTNPGIYLLTIGPASGYQERVPIVEMTAGGVSSSCGNRFATQGVQFRLAQILLGTDQTGLRGEMVKLANLIQTQLDKGAPAASVAAALSKFRNGVAHLCFGTERLAQYTAAPFAFMRQADPFAAYGLMDELRTEALLTDCEVPLALLYWTRSGVQFVDLWSVRRPLIPPWAAWEWAPLLGSRRPLETLAMYFQFEAQVEDTIASGLPQSALSQARAIDWFRFLPPAGIIPLAGFGAARGFAPVQFFNGHTTRAPVFVEGIVLEPLVRESLFYQPVDMAKQEMMWLYTVRENMQAVAATVVNRPAACLVFATGYIPYRGNAQYDLAHWNFGNFALISQLKE
jgi:hypothetical protein